MADTANLILPLMSAAQSQKHVTHNEAVLRLDVLVQLAVKSTTLTAPPGAPADGDRYLIATGATGAWAGKDLNITYYSSGAWVFLPPRKGWLCWDEVNGLLLTYKGAPTYWVQDLVNAASLATLLASGTTASRIGINTASDTNNRLAVKANSFFFSHDDVTPGTGDIRGSLNKSTSAKDASLTFNTNWSARAIFGLLGSDLFTLKVSTDGSTFNTVFRVDPGAIGGAGALRISPNGENGPGYVFIGPNLISTAFTSGGPAMEVSIDIPGDRYAFFDFHASDSQSDYSSRLMRNPGANADFVIENVGTGNINLNSSGNVRLFAGATPRTRQSATALSPYSDNAYSLGESGLRWSAVWAANGTIQTSDARDKDVVDELSAEASGALIDAVQPKLFRWKIGENRVVEASRRRELLEPGNPNSKHREVVETEVVAVPGRRVHSGFLAQDLRGAMLAQKLDFAAWGLEDKDDPDSRQWMRPDQLVPVLWSAVRDLRHRLALIEHQPSATNPAVTKK